MVVGFEPFRQLQFRCVKPKKGNVTLGATSKGPFYLLLCKYDIPRITVTITNNRSVIKKSHQTICHYHVIRCYYTYSFDPWIVMDWSDIVVAFFVVAVLPGTRVQFDIVAKLNFSSEVWPNFAQVQISHFGEK